MYISNSVRVSVGVLRQKSEKCACKIVLVQAQKIVLITQQAQTRAQKQQAHFTLTHLEQQGQTFNDNCISS